MPVIIPNNYCIVNYFLEILVDISVGYIISLIFYFLVVFYPDYLKSKNISFTIKQIFLRMNTYIGYFLDEITSCYNLESIEEWEKKVVKLMDYEQAAYYLFLKFTNYTDFRYDIEITNKTTYYEVLISIVNDFYKQYNQLTPYVVFFNSDILDFYNEISSLYILEYFLKIEDDCFNYIPEQVSRIVELKRKLEAILNNKESFYFC